MKGGPELLRVFLRFVGEGSTSLHDRFGTSPHIVKHVCAGKSSMLDAQMAL